MDYLPRGNDSNSGLSAKFRNSNEQLLAPGFLWTFGLTNPVFVSHIQKLKIFCRKKSDSEVRSSTFPTVHWEEGWEEPSLCCCSGPKKTPAEKKCGFKRRQATKPVRSAFIIEQQSSMKGATDPCFVQWSRERVLMQPGGRACFLSKCTLSFIVPTHCL